jgi:LytS/YehU family sensor histidine kinase
LSSLVINQETREKKTQALFLLLTCLLIAVGIAAMLYFYFRLRKINREIVLQQAQTISNTEIVNKLNQEKARVSSQLDPEIFFRTINRLEQNSQREVTAEKNLELVNELAVVMRSSLNLVTSERIGLSDEIAFLTSYFRLEDLNDNLQKKAVFGFENDADTEGYAIAPMLVQPIVHHILHQHSARPDQEFPVFYFRMSNIENTPCFEVRVTPLPKSTIDKNNKAYTVALARIEQEWIKAGKNVHGVHQTSGELVIGIPLEELY